MIKKLSKIVFIVLLLLLSILFLGGSISILIHLLEIILIAHFFINIKEYGLKNVILSCSFLVYGLVISLIIDSRYFVSIYYNIFIPMILFFYGYKKLDLNRITFFYIILAISSFILLYFSFQTLQRGFEYKEGFYVSEFSRVYQHFITGRLIIGTDAILFSVPIVLATFLIILLKKNIFLIFGFILAYLYILEVTKTRSGMLFLISLLLTLVYSRFKLDINKSFFFILMAFGLVYFSLDSYGVIPERFSINYNSNVGLNERDLIWALHLIKISNNPFGNFERIEFNYLAVSTHNTILDYFYSLGWLMGSLFIIFYIKNIFLFVKNSLNSKVLNKKRLFSLMMVFLFVYLNVESVSESNNYAYYSIAIFTGFYYKFIKL
jgi:hypothetical protein